jgi:hypothetical protein
VQALLGTARPRVELSRLVAALSSAGADPRVRGLVGVLGVLGDTGAGVGLAQVQELREAVAAFR